MYRSLGVVSLTVSVIGLGLAGCAAPSSAPAVGAPTSGAQSATPTKLDCSPASLQTLTPGIFTVSTSKPAYPPYVIDDDPTTGKGFESALAYDLADQLGYPKDKVEWAFVTFEQTYAPGAKTYDVGLQQIGINPDRAKSVTFSRPYYTGPQAVVALKSNKAASSATSVAALKSLKLGAQVGTTSLKFISSAIAPAAQPYVFNDTEGAKAALKNGTIDAIVVDLPTAFYISNVEIEKSAVVGQFADSEASGESWGLTMKKGSSLQPCVDQALDTLDANGTLDALRKQWLDDSKVPVFTP